MFGLLDYIKFGVGAVVGAAVISVPVYMYGKFEGKKSAQVSALTQTVKVLKKRGEIDAQVSSADAATLCRLIGLPNDDQTECVRRVLEADPQP